MIVENRFITDYSYILYFVVPSYLQFLNQNTILTR